jgi:YgiT-type zinc finger domain-containing protein
MVDSFTTFVIVRDGAAYIVENAPCLECPVCENTAFAQDVARKLETYCSGRAVPDTTANAYVYRWGTTLVEIPTGEVEPATHNTPVTLTTLGTEYGKETPRYEPVTSPSHFSRSG